MSVVATTPERRYTVKDLDAVPDDGRRYEVLDGALLMTPSPFWPHQRAAFRVARLLDDARPPGLEVLLAPYDVLFSEFTVLEPDVLVAQLGDLPERGRYAGIPSLVVEVLSPSTTSRDRRLKRSAYERHGVPAYWLVDPDLARPAVTVLELAGASYREVATLRGEEKADVTVPFPVTLCPADLVAEQ
jgi:Uma2 family endonuclease